MNTNVREIEGKRLTDLIEYPETQLSVEEMKKIEEYEKKITNAIKSDNALINKFASIYIDKAKTYVQKTMVSIISMIENEGLELDEKSIMNSDTSPIRFTRTGGSQRVLCTDNKAVLETLIDRELPSAKIFEMLYEETDVHKLDINDLWRGGMNSMHIICDVVKLRRTLKGMTGAPLLKKVIELISRDITHSCLRNIIVKSLVLQLEESIAFSSNGERIAQHLMNDPKTDNFFIFHNLYAFLSHAGMFSEAASEYDFRMINAAVLSSMSIERTVDSLFVGIYKDITGVDLGAGFTSGSLMHFLPRISIEASSERPDKMKIQRNSLYFYRNRDHSPYGTCIDIYPAAVAWLGSCLTSILTIGSPALNGYVESSKYKLGIGNKNIENNAQRLIRNAYDRPKETAQLCKKFAALQNKVLKERKIENSKIEKKTSIESVDPTEDRELALEEYFGKDNPLRLKLIDFAHWIRVSNVLKAKGKDLDVIKEELEHHKRDFEQILNVESCDIGFMREMNAFSFPIFVDKDIHAELFDAYNLPLKDKMAVYNKAIAKMERMSDFIAVDKVGYRFTDKKDKHLTICVGLGLISAGLSDDEVAAIICHEIGHFFESIYIDAPRSLANGIEQSLNRSATMIYGGLVLSAFFHIMIIGLLGALVSPVAAIAFLFTVGLGYLVRFLYSLGAKNSSPAEVMRKLDNDKLGLLSYFLSDKKDLPNTSANSLSRDDISNYVNNVYGVGKSKFEKAKFEKEFIDKYRSQSKRARQIKKEERQKDWSLFSKFLHGFCRVYSKIFFFGALRSLRTVMDAHCRAYQARERIESVSSKFITRNVTSSANTLTSEVFSDYFATAHGFGTALAAALNIMFGAKSGSGAEKWTGNRFKSISKSGTTKFVISTKDPEVLKNFMKVRELEKTIGAAKGAIIKTNHDIEKKTIEAASSSNLRNVVLAGNGMVSLNQHRDTEDGQDADWYLYQMGHGYLANPSRIKSFYVATKKELDTLPKTKEYANMRKALEADLVILHDEYVTYLNGCDSTGSYTRALIEQYHKKGIGATDYSDVAKIMVDHMNSKTLAYHAKYGEDGASTIQKIRRVMPTLLTDREHIAIEKALTDGTVRKLSEEVDRVVEDAINVSDQMPSRKYKVTESDEGSLEALYDYNLLMHRDGWAEVVDDPANEGLDLSGSIKGVIQDTFTKANSGSSLFSKLREGMQTVKYLMTVQSIIRNRFK